ncbi:MAG: endolytic transglycosylase MltG [Treponemataceae bacterium]|nr:endolytic transglycosylase MltG [Treponemataceae bacterium]
MKTKKKLVVLIICACAALMVCGIGIFASLFTAKSNEENAVEYRLKVGKGEGSKAIAADLKANNIIKSKYAFYIYARLRKPSVKAGVYTVSSSLNPSQIFDVLESGKQESIVVSVPEGLTMRRIGALLEENEVCSQEEFLEACKDADLLRSFGFDPEKIVNFEGFLFPDTYYFSPSMGGEDVVKIMVDNFYSRTSEIKNFSSLSVDKMYYTLRLASIVEREYRLEEEAPLIASVFANRLRRTIGLYSCATVEYIITEIEGRPHPEVITYNDLKIDSPYNTYLYAGLPPTPISNPGLVALDAATNTPRTKYYFFRLVDPAVGRHHFSTDFEEHTETGRLVK